MSWAFAVRQALCQIINFLQRAWYSYAHFAAKEVEAEQGEESIGPGHPAS